VTVIDWLLAIWAAGLFPAYLAMYRINEGSIFHKPWSPFSHWLQSTAAAVSFILLWPIPAVIAFGFTMIGLIYYWTIRP